MGRTNIFTWLWLVYLIGNFRGQFNLMTPPENEPKFVIYIQIRDNAN